MIAFYNEIAILVQEGRTVDIVCLNFSKDVTHNILIEKLMKYWDSEVDYLKLSEMPGPRIVIHGIKSSWRPVTSGVPWSHQFVQSHFTSSLMIRKVEQHTHSASWLITELGRVADTLECCAVLQRGRQEGYQEVSGAITPLEPEVTMPHLEYCVRLSPAKVHKNA